MGWRKERMAKFDPANTPLQGHPDKTDIMVLRMKMRASRVTFGKMLGGFTDSTVYAWETGRTNMPEAAWVLALLLAGEHPEYKMERKPSQSIATILGYGKDPQLAGALLSPGSRLN